MQVTSQFKTVALVGRNNTPGIGEPLTALAACIAIVAALVGMVLSFFAGLAALRWLSSWLESGRWS